LGYYLVLRRLTFYTLNRVYLIIAIIFSSVYPLINLNSFAQHHQQLAGKVQLIAIKWNEADIQELAYWHWAEIVLWAGALLFAMRLVVQLLSLYKLHKTSEQAVLHEQPVRLIKADVGPFSFWQNIYINPQNLSSTDLESVLQHEQVHIKEWHTLDILLAEISVIFYWFNPGIWLIKKAVSENIEFITDRKILQKGIDSKTYQYSLLNVSFSATSSAGITNNFNFSTLKKRIQMMNAKRSSKFTLTRYAFLVPAVAICLFAISLSKAELVTHSRIAFKTIAASVSNFKIVTVPVNVELKKPAVHYKIKADTGKKDEIAIQNVKTDSDTGRKLVFKVKLTDTVVFYRDGKKVSKDPQLNPNEIESFNVVNNGTGKQIYIKTKTATDPNSTTTGKVIPADAKPSNGNMVTIYSGSLTKKAADPAPDKLKVVDIRLIPPPDHTDFTDKLTLIDGKEATAMQLKKLPAASIEGIIVYDCNSDTGDGTSFKTKYGDKAEKGVLWIILKKTGN
jgi:bla regulator protein BlaR1